MSNLGQKIKEAFTGHHDQDKSGVKTPDVNAPGAFPSDDFATKHHSDRNKLTKDAPEHVLQDKKEVVEKGAQHHTGHSHHDPEPEAKQATSDAGNYPYWGNLPREGGQHVHRSDGPDSDPTKQHHGLIKDSSLATGGSTVGASAIGAGYFGSDNSKDPDTSRRDDMTRADSTDNSKFDHASKSAGAAGLVGATYLATRDKDDADKGEKNPISEDSNAPTHTNNNTTVEESKTSMTTQKPAEAATPTKTSSAGDNNSHRKEGEALAAGAGAAGLAGAGYYASQRGDKKDDEKRDTSSHATQESNTKTSGHIGTAHYDPTIETQKATSAAGNYPHWENDDNKNKVAKDNGSVEAATPSKTTLSGDNDSHRKEKEALAARAGASGLAGAGYLASKNREDRKEDKQSSPMLSHPTSKADEHRTHTSTGQHDPGNDAKRATSGAGNYPHWDDQKKEHDHNKGIAAAGVGGAGLAGAGYSASNRKEEHNDELSGSTRETSSGVAASRSLAQRDTTSRQIEPTSGGGIHNTVVGAGSSEYSPPVGTSNIIGDSHQSPPYSQPSQPVAQAAAQQAWNKQQPGSFNTSDDKSTNSKHSDLKHAAAGTAFGAGAAGIATNYGQRKNHEENPRTDQAEQVAERALGSDGKPHAPSATGDSGGAGMSTSSGLSPGASGLAGQSGSTGNGAKVLHKCEQCGHDNDISRYFDRDAVFRSQQ